jgi:hypothetical protein
MISSSNDDQDRSTSPLMTAGMTTSISSYFLADKPRSMNPVAKFNGQRSRSGANKQGPGVDLLTCVGVDGTKGKSLPDLSDSPFCSSA